MCPRCQNPMRTVDRRGVHIEQCQGCRGIFLDRGELEQIAAAEQSYYATPPSYAEPHAHAHRDSPPPYARRRGHRRRGFLEELFD